MGNYCGSRKNSIRITNAIPNSTMLVIISTQRMQLRHKDKKFNTDWKFKFDSPDAVTRVPIPDASAEINKNITEKLQREEEYRDETLYQFDTKNIFLEDGDCYLTINIYPSTKFDSAKDLIKPNSSDPVMVNNLKPQFNISQDTIMIGDTAMIDYNAMNIQYRWYVNKFSNAEKQSIIRTVRNRPLIKKDDTDIIFYIQDGFIRQGKLFPGKKFRMIESGTLQRKNYPPGILCPICGQNTCCTQDCSQTNGYIRRNMFDKRIKAVQLIDGKQTQKRMYHMPEARLRQRQTENMKNMPRIGGPQNRATQVLKNNSR